MIKAKRRWFAVFVALLATLALYLVRNDKPISHSSNVFVNESSGPSVSAELPQTMAPANPFQQKLDEQKQRSIATPHVLSNPKAAQDPFKAFLEEQSEMAHQSPFVK